MASVAYAFTSRSIVQIGVHVLLSERFPPPQIPSTRKAVLCGLLPPRNPFVECHMHHIVRTFNLQRSDVPTDCRASRSEKKSQKPTSCPTWDCPKMGSPIIILILGICKTAHLMFGDVGRRGRLLVRGACSRFSRPRTSGERFRVGLLLGKIKWQHAYLVVCDTWLGLVTHMNGIVHALCC